MALTRERADQLVLFTITIISFGSVPSVSSDSGFVNWYLLDQLLILVTNFSAFTLDWVKTRTFTPWNEVHALLTELALLLAPGSRRAAAEEARSRAEGGRGAGVRRGRHVLVGGGRGGADLHGQGRRRRLLVFGGGGRGAGLHGHGRRRGHHELRDWGRGGANLHGQGRRRGRHVLRGGGRGAGSGSV